MVLIVHAQGKEAVKCGIINNTNKAGFMIDYMNLDRLLLQVHAEISAAGCHGFLCGQICGFAIYDEELWMEYMNVKSNDDDLVV